jgi:hypothetical protein
MPLQATSGAASYDAFGSGAAAVPQYIEEVFQTWLYTGTGANLTINNGIDLAGKGGMTWFKQRDSTRSPTVFDTINGTGKYLSTDAGSPLNTGFSDTLTAFNANGFSLGADSGTLRVNASLGTYASWTFRKQPKFFDMVTYTGDGTAGRQIPHSLGSVPGCIIVKSTDNTVAWAVYHSSLGATKYMTLNLTDAEATNSNYWNNTEPTSTAFTVAGTFPTNRSGYAYVAYIFANNAGGFGLTGTDNVISCGSYVGNGSSTAGPIVNLGYEPQFLLIKASSGGLAGSNNWQMLDVMRGMGYSGSAINLAANTSGSESFSTSIRLNLSATGFQVQTTSSGYNESGTTYIYIAIRRGPMKVPTTGASVFTPVARTGDGTGGNPSAVTTGIVTDMAMVANRTSNVSKFNTVARLTNNQFLRTALTNAEAGSGPAFPNNTFDLQNGFFVGNDSDSATLTNGNGSTYINYAFQRAPGFFDEVCYTGTGVARTVAHNLTVAPELIILKARDSSSYDWMVWQSSLPSTNMLYLNTNAQSADDPGRVSSVSATTFGVTSFGNVNNSGTNFIAYLFASCPGVSKVGSFTGTGATQTINCGFTGGARFVLIKSTSTTGDWYVWDSARGIVAGNDPYSRLNSTLTEITTTDWVDTAASGFELSNAGGNLANSNGVSYIFLAIA